MVNVLTRKFGIPLKDIEGGYRLECRITGAPCSLCRPPQEAAYCKWGELRMYGITPLEASILMALDAEEDMRELMIAVFMKTGELPGEGKHYSEEEVRQRIDDPLGTFPNDVRYPSQQEIDNLRQAQTATSKYMKKPLPEHCLWNDRRVAARFGEEGAAAKRASVNDGLWGRYLDYKKRGIPFTLRHLEELLEYEENLKTLMAEQDPLKQDEIFNSMRI